MYSELEHLRWSYLRKIVDSFLLLTIFAESSILAVRLGSEYAYKLQHIACNRTRTPPHMPKTSLTLILYYIISFIVSLDSKSVLILILKNKKNKKKLFQFFKFFLVSISLFISSNWKHLAFSMKHTRTSEKQMVENSIIIQYLTFFSDIIFILFP